jgi:RND family efflux transporter MFP subunit
MTEKAKRILIGVGIMVAAVAALVVMTSMRKGPSRVADKPLPPLVEVQAVAPETVHFRVQSQGTVAPYARTNVVAEVKGKVVEMSGKLRTGGFFQKGEWLLTIDPGDYETGLAEAQAQLAVQQARLAEEEARAEQAAREWQLTGKPLSAAPALALRQPQIALAKANVAVAQAGVERARRQLERTRVQAPYDAWVESVQVYTGQFVPAGSTLATVFSARKAEVSLPVTEQDMPFIRLPGSSDAREIVVHFRNTSSSRSSVWEGRLVRVDARMDERNRVYRVIAELDDPYALKGEAKREPLRVGTFVQAEIEGIEMEQVYRIPRALVREGNRVLVRDQEGRLRARQLVLLHEDREWAYAASGFAPGDAVITSPLESWVEGMSLRTAGDGLSEGPVSASTDGTPVNEEVQP